MDRQMNNNTMDGMARNTSRVLAPPGGRSSVFFGEDPAPKAAAVAKAAPAVSAGFQAAVKTTDSATNTAATDESAASFARNKRKNTISQITF
ncbi:unnamed protein product [Oikopleura dioica]|uniref:Uncharacterized protein n=1 Tax=Oikopleura dioica TaxID=34765 RepID=E4XA41_OIKDI|nr:unnamed protein product [Oikopleura dioica]CBY42146.1 unnamed protein product [Oikopleura dioica]